MTREELVSLLKKHGLPKKILDAFRKVSREKFVPREFLRHAYENTTFPIGYGQTISQPQVVALMLSLLELRKGHKVLEIGSGSGYVLALLSEIVGKRGKVFGIERIKQLADTSQKKLSRYKNVKVFFGRETDVLPKKEKFHRILISAALREIPEKILSRLKKDGILVAPKGPTFEQSLVVVQKQQDGKLITKNTIPGFIFVPFVEDVEEEK